MSISEQLIVIVGETASGKSALAVELAERWNGEVICADSRTVYTGMDIGTAKPSMQDQARVRHHLLDIIEPGQVFTAGEFQRRANAAITDIQNRGKLPIMVGGTGLYIDGVIFDFKFLPPVSPHERARLNALSIDELQAEIIAKDLPMPMNEHNPRHLMRTIETNGAAQQRSALRPNTLVVGLKIAPDILKQRITSRVDNMFAAGFERETRQLAAQYGWDAPGLLSTGYKAARGYIEGLATLEEAKAQFILNDLHLAKHQRTWFKRNPHIQWYNTVNEATEAVARIMSAR